MEIGDRVYHRNLKRYGIFKGFDTDPTACFVEFDADEYGMTDELCVTISQLDIVEYKGTFFNMRISSYLHRSIVTYAIEHEQNLAIVKLCVCIEGNVNKIISLQTMRYLREIGELYGKSLNEYEVFGFGFNAKNNVLAIYVTEITSI